MIGVSSSLTCSYADCLLGNGDMLIVDNLKRAIVWKLMNVYGVT